MAKVTITLEDKPGLEDGFVLNVLFEPELDGAVDFNQLTPAQQAAGVALGAIRGASSHLPAKEH